MTNMFLDDEQIRHFITDGILLFQLDFPASFHVGLIEELSTLLGTHGDPGHALIPQIARAQAIIEHPVIHGALWSLLGPNYLVDPCRHIHLNNHPGVGEWHQDDYCELPFPHSQYPSILILCYFPQDTPPEMGPTGCMPGSQYSNMPPPTDTGELLISGPAGICALMRGDLWHRATANSTGRQRYMLKFLFTRQSAPRNPHWTCHNRTWRQPLALASTIVPQESVWHAVWAWMCGDAPEKEKE